MGEHGEGRPFDSISRNVFRKWKSLITSLQIELLSGEKFLNPSSGTELFTR